MTHKLHCQIYPSKIIIPIKGFYVGCNEIKLYGEKLESLVKNSVTSLRIFDDNIEIFCFVSNNLPKYNKILNDDVVQFYIKDLYIENF